MSGGETPPLRGPHPTETRKIANLLFNIAYMKFK